MATFTYNGWRDHVGSQGLSAPSLIAINTLSNPQSRKAKSTSKSAASTKHRWDALNDGEDACSGMVCTFPTCSDIPTLSPSAPPSRSSNAASMITLAGAVASLGTSINHQTMTSDIQIANKVQGFINSQDYLTDLEKSLAGEYYAMQSTLSSGLLSMKPSVAKITLQHRVRALARNIEEEMEDVSVEDAWCVAALLRRLVRLGHYSFLVLFLLICFFALW